MKTTPNFFLSLPKTAFQSNSLNKILFSNLTLPKKIFPPDFLIVEKDFICGGYFVCYNQQVAVENIIAACRTGKWQFFNNLIGEYVIIYCNFINHELFILTDQSGKFPCYFAISDDHFRVSTDFGLVKQALQRKTLNIDVALDYVAVNPFTFVSDQTILLEIQQIPPGSLLKINSDFSYSLQPLLDLEKFINEKQPPYTSIEKFTHDFLMLLEQIILERLQVIDSLSFGADLSSGFDSPLICYLLKKLSQSPFTCYSDISPYTTETDDPKIVSAFANKHNLQVEFVLSTDFYPFHSSKDLDLSVRQPMLSVYESHRHYLAHLCKQQTKIVFTGEGGDELYGAYAMDSLLSPVQDEYNLLAGRVKEENLDIILTQKAINRLLNQQRLLTKCYYPFIFAHSFVGGNIFIFPIYWETGIWPMTPFADPRLIKLARLIPMKNSRGFPRQELWQHRRDIFLEEQFRPKVPEGRFANLYLEERLGFVTKLLENSILSQLGLVRTADIIRDLKQGAIEKYSQYTYLICLLRLEYFLQHNNVSIPN